jgi:hypothetical protein
MTKKSRIGLGLAGIGLLTAVIQLLSGIVELVTKVVSYGYRHPELQIRVQA